MEITRENVIRLTDYRPWGKFTILAEEKGHKIKRIAVNPGHRLSLQRHKHRTEHWLIVSGRCSVTLNDALLHLNPGDSIDIEIGDAHRVQNDEVDDLIFIEIQLGNYFGEDDIERLEDDYGRKKHTISPP